MIDYAPSPDAYAAKLASYIKDPSTIRARTIDFWGRAPSVKQCAALIRKRQEKKKREEGRWGAAMSFSGSFPCGHDRSEENSYITEAGSQTCKTCQKERMRLASQRKRDKERAEKEKRERLLNAEARLARRKRRQAELMEKASAVSRGYAGRVIEMVCDMLAIDRELVMARNRAAMVVHARAVIAKVLIDTGFSYAETGRVMGRDHSSVINLIGKFDIYAKQEPRLLEVYEALR